MLGASYRGGGVVDKLSKAAMCRLRNDAYWMSETCYCQPEILCKMQWSRLLFM